MAYFNGKKVLSVDLKTKVPTAQLEITENGEYNVMQYGSVNVQTSGGGEQPTLYAPVVTGGVNQISWANNPNNGAYGTLSATLNGVTVTSPLTVTQDMDGQTLTITVSETDFQSASTSITVSYMTSNDHVVAVGSAHEAFFLQENNFNISFNSGDVTNSRPILKWDGTATTKIFTQTVTIGSRGGNSFGIACTKYSTTAEKKLIPGSVSPNGNYPITGTVVIKNITQNEEKTWTFNNTASTVGVTVTNWQVGDVLQFAININ